MLTLSQGNNNEGEQDEINEKDIKLFIMREHPLKNLKLSEKTLDFTAFFVQLTIIVPQIKAVCLGRDNQRIANSTAVLRVSSPSYARSISRFVPFAALLSSRKSAPFGRVMYVARQKAKHYGCSSIRGNHMNLGCPTASRSPDALLSCFLKPHTIGMDLDRCAVHTYCRHRNLYDAFLLHGRKDSV